MATEYASLEEFSRDFLDLLAHGVEDYNPLFDQLAQAVRAETFQGFQREVDPDGVPWKPLKRPRRNSKGRDRILQDKGFMRSSVTAKGARNSFERREHMAMEMGTNIDYAVYHQYGTRFIPVRQFLGVSAALADRMREIAGDWVQEIIEEIVSR